ncbi:hypothetical protein AB0F64_34310 [Streptomyces sp. NPDC026294]|uniref:alpha/beta fold hydrolase n=1 Tax=Streptomyces sp. NPDC026294 TaxID=3155362 RepID=UPI00340895C5
MRAEGGAGRRTRLQRTGRDGRTLVFVHGFLDGKRLWDDVIRELKTQGVRTVRLDLTGLGERTDADGPCMLDRLTAVGARVRHEVVRALAGCWNVGHPNGRRPSRYQYPVLATRGADDGFITEGLVTGGVLRRCGSIEAATVDGAGHWVHVERSAAVAALLDVLPGRRRRHAARPAVPPGRPRPASGEIARDM